MNPYALPSLAAAVCSFGTGVAVFARNPRAPLTRAFLAYALVFAVVYFIKYHQLSAVDHEAVVLWVTMGGMVWPFIMPSLWL